MLNIQQRSCRVIRDAGWQPSGGIRDALVFPASSSVYASRCVDRTSEVSVWPVRRSYEDPRHHERPPSSDQCRSRRTFRPSTCQTPATASRSRRRGGSVTRPAGHRVGPPLKAGRARRASLTTPSDRGRTRHDEFTNRSLAAGFASISRPATSETRRVERRCVGSRHIPPPQKKRRKKKKPPQKTPPLRTDASVVLMRP